MRSLNVGFTYDAKTDYELLPGDAQDKYAEFDFEETLVEIEDSIKSAGHKIERVGHVKTLLRKLMSGEKWDIIFNIAEGIKGRNRESQVPLVLELFGIPYVCSDALTMGATLDKVVAKSIVSSAGVLTPKFLKIEKISQLSPKKFNLKYPVIIKPSEEGTSKGIESDSLARDFKHVKKRTQWLIEKYNQPALIEEFIIGSEFTVAVIENDPPNVLPPVRIDIQGKSYLGEEFYTYARVENDDIGYICPAKMPKSLEKKLKIMALASYKALGIKDVGRVDIRVNKKGVPYFLECNPLPNLGKGDIFPLVANAAGFSYEEAICKIFNSALKRYNLS
ncbi:MAG: ATP-grasp domain-containing protein [Elusimicrobia bacterium]|nr:ATP-grasp domain-containing protein [Elusimicrobiota bacterium]